MRKIPLLACAFSILFLLPGLLSAQSQGGQYLGGGVEARLYSDRSDIVDPFLSTEAGVGAKTIRLVFLNQDQQDAATNGTSYSQAQYRQWFDNDVLPQLATLIPHFLGLGAEQIMISLQTPYLGRDVNANPPVDNIFKVGNQAAIDFMIELWAEIATLYNGYPQLVYQIFSEPIWPEDNSGVYSAFQQQFNTAIRGATPNIPVNEQPIIGVMGYAGLMDKTKSIKTEYITGRGAVVFNYYGHVQKIWNYTHQGTASARNNDIIEWPGCTIISTSNLSRASSNNSKASRLKAKAKQKLKAAKVAQKAAKKLEKQVNKIQEQLEDPELDADKRAELEAKLGSLNEKYQKLQQKVTELKEKAKELKEKAKASKNGGTGGGSGLTGDPCTREGVADGLSDIVAFADAVNFKPIVAEVSVSRFAPGAANYLDDVFSVFDDLNIDAHYLNYTDAFTSPWALTCTSNNPDGSDPLGSSCNAGTSPAPRLEIVRDWLNLPTL